MKVMEFMNTELKDVTYQIDLNEQQYREFLALCNEEKIVWLKNMKADWVEVDSDEPVNPSPPNITGIWDKNHAVPEILFLVEDEPEEETIDEEPWDEPEQNTHRLEFSRAVKEGHY